MNNPVNAETEATNADLLGLIIVFLFFAIYIPTVSFIGTYYWTVTGQTIANKWSEKYFAALLRQEISWFDINNAETLAVGIPEYVS